MKALLATILITVSALVCAQQPPALTPYQQSYAKQEQAIVAKYGTTLTIRMAELKKKGDLDGYLLLQAEEKRFQEAKCVPAPKEAHEAFRPLTEAHFQELATLLEKYIKALDGLIKSETAADRIESAKAVKAEKDKATAMLEEVKVKLPLKEGFQTPTLPEQEKPVALKPLFKAKTFVDETRGWAGLYPRNNVYTFKVESVGKKATFRFWASGDISTDTAGQVLLSGPDLKDQIIRAWKPSDFKVAANTVRSYKNLKPIACDVTSYLKQSGDYQFTFKWGGSQVGLSILRVELELQ